MVNEKFKEDLVKWNNYKKEIDQINLHIKKYHDRIKNLKVNSDNIEKKLVKYMQNNNMNSKKIIIENNSITFQESKRSESISKKYLLEKLEKYFKNKKEAEKIVDFIYNSREITTKYVLKRK